MNSFLWPSNFDAGWKPHVSATSMRAGQVIRHCSDEAAPVCAAAAIGSNIYVGDHLALVEAKWQTHSAASKAQLDKIDMGSSDIKDISETLLNLSQW